MTLVLCCLFAGDGMVIERLFGPELPFKYKHPASIAELSNGDLLIAYFGGSGEYQSDTAVHLSRRRRDASRWSTPRILSSERALPEGNPVVWQAPDGLVWLFNVVRHGETWSTSTIDARTSKDGGETWGKPFPLTTEQGTMVRSKPIVLPDGHYLLPVYHETGADPESVGADTCSFFLIHDVATGRWRETNRVHSRLGNLQPAPAIVEGDYLVAYCRRGGDYQPRDDAWAVRTESRDGGKTWSEGKETSIPNPNAAVDFHRLASGHLLLVFNDSKTRRTPLVAALSTDKDKSYPHRRIIAGGDGDYGYPFAIQGKDGRIHVVYTSDRRSVVNHAVFSEQALLERSGK